MNLRFRNRHAAVVIIILALLTACLFFLWPRNLFVIVPSNSNFEISAASTSGTKHVYFCGGSGLNVMLDRLANRDAYRLRYSCKERRTVVWVRVVEKSDPRQLPSVSTGILQRFPEGGYGILRARLVSAARTETILATTGRTLYLHPTVHTQGHAEGWLLNGSFEDQQGSVVHIETPEGLAIAKLYFP